VDLFFRTTDDEVPVTVSADGSDWRLEIGGQSVPLQATRDRDGSWLVETHQGRRRLWVAGRGDERFVFCDGKVHTLRLVEPGDGGADEGLGGGPCLVADMPGKVVQVKVAVGETVAAGQTLLVLESMKMETELAAAVGGEVVAVHVATGDVVGQGAALVDVAPEAEAS